LRRLLDLQRFLGLLDGGNDSPCKDTGPPIALGFDKDLQASDFLGQHHKADGFADG